MLLISLSFDINTDLSFCVAHSHSRLAFSFLVEHMGGHKLLPFKDSLEEWRRGKKKKNSSQILPLCFSHSHEQRQHVSVFHVRPLHVSRDVKLLSKCKNTFKDIKFHALL